MQSITTENDREMRSLMSCVYDYIFKNDQYKLTDFGAEFPDSFVDFGAGVIYLNGSDKLPPLKITIQECRE